MVRLLLSLIAGLLLIPVALGFTIFSARSTTVNCARVTGHVSCAEIERIGPYVAWSKSVENIAIARDMSQSGSAEGVVAETEAGQQVQLTSTFLDQNQQAAIADRIHQFIFVQQDQDTLALNVPPSLLNLALGGAFTLVMVIWTLITALRIGRRLLSGRQA